jgi:hypothetical protein
MVVKKLHTIIADPTVHRTFWSDYHAREAKFESGDESFLTVQPVYHKIILELPSPFQGVLIVWLLGD